jgi:Ca2+-binding EF-hand superfamily protein
MDRFSVMALGMVCGVFSLGSVDVLGAEGGKPKPEKGSMAERIFGRFDADGDGKVLLSELPPPVAERLKSADKDNDGSVTKEELASAAPGGKPNGKKPAPADGPNPLKLLEKLDANGDGKLEGDEIPERMKERVARIDANGDGAIDKSELEAMATKMKKPGGPEGLGGRPITPAMIEQLKSLDVDGDGKIPLADLPEMAQRFAKRLDKDGDGSLTVAELEALPTGRPESGLGNLDLTAGPDALFKNFDGNNDGKLSKEELTAIPNLPLAKLDSNGDGDLTKEEVGEHWSKIQARMGAGLGKKPRGPSEQVGARQLFHQQDADADGRLTKEEAKGTLAEKFSTLDTNGDEKLDEQEVEKGFLSDQSDRPKKKNKNKNKPKEGTEV